MITERGHDAYQMALLSEQPDHALRTVASERLMAGTPRERLIEEFESLRDRLREAHRDADEDVVLDVMDYVVGFSSPHMRL